MNITELVLEIRPEKKIQACTGLEPMTFAIPVQHSTTELTSQLGANIILVLDLNKSSK